MLFNLSDAWAQSAETRTAEGQTEIKPLQIGDTIPEELWHLPFEVINHPTGKDTITLDKYRSRNVIILDFWASYCSPCIKSLKKVEQILSESTLGHKAILCPVLVHDTRSRGQKFLNDWEGDLWSFNDKDYDLKEYFSNYITGFGVVILSGGRFVGAPIPKTVSKENIERQIIGDEQVQWLNIEYRKGGDNEL